MAYEDRAGRDPDQCRCEVPNCELDCPRSGPSLIAAARWLVAGASKSLASRLREICGALRTKVQHRRDPDDVGIPDGVVSSSPDDDLLCRSKVKLKRDDLTLVRPPSRDARETRPPPIICRQQISYHFISGQCVRTCAAHMFRHGASGPHQERAGAG